MGLLRFLFGDVEIQPENQKKKQPEMDDFFEMDYERYYGSLHDDAMCGDIEAQKEMKEEFGDDWNEEF